MNIVQSLGITLTKNTALTTDSMVDLVLNQEEGRRILVDDPNLIRRDVRNLRISVLDKAYKTLKVTSRNKRFFITDVHSSLPFGYCK